MDERREPPGFESVDNEEEEDGDEAPDELVDRTKIVFVSPPPNATSRPSSDARRLADPRIGLLTADAEMVFLMGAGISCGEAQLPDFRVRPRVEDDETEMGKGCVLVVVFVEADVEVEGEEKEEGMAICESGSTS